MCAAGPDAAGRVAVGEDAVHGRGLRDPMSGAAPAFVVSSLLPVTWGAARACAAPSPNCANPGFNARVLA